ncbi:hypothetical protein [Agrococcus sp. DT81.2]|uniref:hypothetical protein n=1 Tax=Agrococcus sp. DT81.2 TaxID=3393414 RepID=UPI003CE5B686
MRPRKDTRLFARLDLDYADHPKIAGLSDGAFRAHVEMILYSRKYLTDGRIAKRVANRLGSEWVSELLSNDAENPSLIELPDGDYLLHGYADMQETKAEVADRSAKNRANGLKGGRKPLTESVTQSVSETEATRVAETETETETETTTPNGVVSVEIDTVAIAFESAWSHWPKKDKKKPALAKFRAAVKKRGLDQLTADVIRYGDAYAAAGTETRFIPGLETWINQERWTDPLPQPVTAQSTGHERAAARQAANMAVVEHFRNLEAAHTDTIWEIEA